jgi:hypothetical protein
MTDLKYGLPAHLIGIPDENGCERWLGGHTGKGYGAFQGSYAHRLVYTNVIGPIPDGLQIDHYECHVHDCVNPTHLRPATNQQNGQNRAGAQANSKSGIRGVCWHKGAKMWHVQVAGADKSYYFRDLEEAELAAIALRDTVYGQEPK